MIPEIVIHHAAYEWAPEEWPVEDIERWHRDRGWNGIGYHWLILEFAEPENWIQVAGRPAYHIGSHARGYNTAQGICICANLSERQPSPELYYAVAQACRGILDLRGWHPLPGGRWEHDEPGTGRFYLRELIVAHRETKATECPGTNFDMDTFFEYLGAL